MGTVLHVPQAPFSQSGQLCQPTSQPFAAFSMDGQLALSTLPALPMQLSYMSTLVVVNCYLVDYVDCEVLTQ